MGHQVLLPAHNALITPSLAHAIARSSVDDSAKPWKIDSIGSEHSPMRSHAWRSTREHAPKR